MRKLLETLCAGLLIGGFACNSTAQVFPNKPMRLVVPFPAGGGTDSLARALADGLTKELGQPVIVDNKAGAGTVVGNDFVSKSAPDGHTLLLNTSAVAIVPSIYPKLPYAFDTGLTAVTVLGRAPNVAVIRNESPISNAKAFLDTAKASPGKLTYGSAGNGTSTHLSVELLKVSAGIFVTHVPYRGATPMITDLLGGQIDVGFGTLPSVAPFLNSGKLKALAVTGSVRSPYFPNIPTFAEVGVKGYEADNWYGIFVAGGTPPATVGALYDAIKRIADTEAFRKRAMAEGLVVTAESSETANRVYKADEAKWRKLVKLQSIKMD
jgi:tripartite-type tricarboxylate transporter receptor subunit TctC